MGAIKAAASQDDAGARMSPVSENGDGGDLREGGRGSGEVGHGGDGGGSEGGSGGGETRADASSAPLSSHERRLEPKPLAKVMWSIGDLSHRFPRLAFPDSLTHVIASWAALDTRAIGVIPMLCQPVTDITEAATEKSINGRGPGCSGPKSGVGSQYGANNTAAHAGRIFLDRLPAASGNASENKYSLLCAGVLVPFGLIPERAAAGCWGEALRLVLAPSSPTPTSSSTGAATLSSDRKHQDDGTEAGGRGTEMGVDGRRKLTLPGGVWDKVLDGGDPEAEDNRALIGTAIRTCKSAGRVDLAHCSTWLKFAELHEEDRTTVVFLCGGGVRLTEVRACVMLTFRSILSHSCFCREGRAIGGNHGFAREGRLEAAFEAKLGAEFLWGLVSRDWAAVLLDCMRQVHFQYISRSHRGAWTVPSHRKCCRHTSFVAVTVELSYLPLKPSVARTCAHVQVRAAFGLFDHEGNGWVSGDRIQACLLDASVRISARYLKQLLSRVCRVAEDGKRFLFEYRKHVTVPAAGDDA
ncbi:unnamed protein product [Scytosiphon promiscuus]